MNKYVAALNLALLLLTAPAAFPATLLVLNKEDSTLSFIDPASGATTGTLATGSGPHEVEVTADGRTAIVSNYGSSGPGNSLSIVDLAGRRERVRLDLGDLRRPHGISLAGTTACFTAEEARAIACLDGAASRIDWRFATNQDQTHMVLASRDGRTLFTTNLRSDSVSIIEHAGQASATQTLVKVGKGPEGMDLSPDGLQLWTANAADGSVSIVDVAGKSLIRSFDIGTRRSNRLKFSPDGKLALVSDLVAGELVVLDVKAQAVRKRIPVGRGATGILIVPDGSKAYVAVSSERRLAVIDLESLEVIAQISTGGGPDGMAWVP